MNSAAATCALSRATCRPVWATFSRRSAVSRANWLTFSAQSVCRARRAARLVADRVLRLRQLLRDGQITLGGNEAGGPEPIIPSRKLCELSLALIEPRDAGPSRLPPASVAAAPRYPG